jgi:hypothetical protein
METQAKTAVVLWLPTAAQYELLRVAKEELRDATPEGIKPALTFPRNGPSYRQLRRGGLPPGHSDSSQEVLF